MAQKTLKLLLQEPKKHSGKYLVEGTEKNTYPELIYVRRDWLGGPQTLPQVVYLTVSTEEPK